MSFEKTNSPSPEFTDSVPNESDKKQLSIERLSETLNGVGEDIGHINQLISEENPLVAKFFKSLLKVLTPLESTMAIPTATLPLVVNDAIQAQIDSSGHLRLTYEDGHKAILNLAEKNNRDILVAVVNDIIPKFKELTTKLEDEKLHEQPAIKETPLPEVPIVPTQPEPLPLEITPTLPITEPEEEPLTPQEPIQTPQEPQIKTISDEQLAKVVALESETLEFLEMLGNEIFEQSPVSKYFDDWMVNLRQIILSFESNEILGPDDIFTNEYNQIFSNIEAELTKRQAADADVEVSARRLIENRYLLNKIDEGFAAQTKELVSKGKDAIDQLTKTITQLEKELAETAQLKVSFRHPLQKIAKDQKISELKQKLTIVKKQLATAVGTSSVEKAKPGDPGSEYEAHTQELSEKRKIAMDLLTKEVTDLENEIAEIEKTKTANPIKRTALAQKRYEATQKLIAAKKRLDVAEQNSNAELERLKTEYEQKKQAAMGNVKNLEKDIATKAADDSAEVRKQAANALAKAVKERIQRKNMSPPDLTTSDEPQTSDQTQTSATQT